MPPTAGVLLLLQCLSLNLKLHDASAKLVQLSRQRVVLDAQSRGGLVNQVDGLVRQLTVTDVAVRKRGRRNKGRVLDAHAVVSVVARLQTAQNRDRVLNGRLADVDRLKAAFEGLVLLDVLAVLLERRGTDATQLATGQGRLEQIAGVHRPLGLAGPNHRVQLIDKEDDLPGRLGDGADDRLEAFLELAAVLRTGDQRAHVERNELLVLQCFGYVARQDALREPLDDGRLAHAGFADEHGVVLRPPGEHLHAAADFLVAADDRIELALAGGFNQVAAVAFERLIRVFGVLRVDAGASADFLEGREDVVALGGVELEDLLGVARHVREREQQVLGRDVLVLHAVGFLLRRRQDFHQAAMGAE